MAVDTDLLQRRVEFLEEQVARLKEAMHGPKFSLDFVDLVYGEVSQEWGIPEAILRVRCKEWRVSEPRHFVAWILRYVGHMSFPRIAQAMGRSDHNSARHACARASQILEAYPREKARVQAVVARITTATPTEKSHA